MPALYFGRWSRANVITELLSTSLPRTLARARSSHDFENLMVVVGGRVELVEEIHSGAEDVAHTLRQKSGSCLPSVSSRSHYLSGARPSEPGSGLDLAGAIEKGYLCFDRTMGSGTALAH
jgi:hypothetical protein